MIDRNLIPVIAFSAVWLLAAAGWIVAVGDYEFLAYIVILLVMAALLWVVHRRIRLPLALIWCMSAWGALHMAGGLVLLPDSFDVGGKTNVLYNWHIAGPYFKYDQLVHAFGFGTTTWLCFCGLRSLAPNLPMPPSFGALTLCVAAGMGFGALNEVIEFTITVLVPENNVGGYVNTAMDLVYNTLGSILAAVALRVYYSSSGKGVSS